MFTLRRISGDGIQMNQEIGKGYTLIHKERNVKEFARTFVEVFDKEWGEDLDSTTDYDCYAFVCECDLIQPLYKNQLNFIMTDSGQTFDNLTFK